MRLVLASASPRRAELLRAAGFTFETCAVDLDEAAGTGETPPSYVRRLAAEKSARASVAQSPATAEGEREEIVVLGADTAVVVDGEIVAKPRDHSEAAAMLSRLSGRRHEVMTGVSLRARGYEVGRVETTVVYFAALSPDEIAWSVASGEGLDKAGAYAIQGLASRFIPRIEGSYSNVVGLPLHCVYELLKELGVGYSLGAIRSRKSL
jgi:septum formation protein